MEEFRTPPRLANRDYKAQLSAFITFCSKNRQRYFRREQNARAAELALKRGRAQGLYWLYAYCVMPDHIHLYLRTRGVRHLSRIVAGLKVDITRSVSDQRIRWQRGYFERIIRGDVAPGSVVRYVLLNPVRAGLVRDPADYPYLGVVDRYV